MFDDGDRGVEALQQLLDRVITLRQVASGSSLSSFASRKNLSTSMGGPISRSKGSRPVDSSTQHDFSALTLEGHDLPSPCTNRVDAGTRRNPVDVHPSFCESVPPEQPIVPINLPSPLSGMPPPEASQKRADECI